MQSRLSLKNLETFQSLKFSADFSHFPSVCLLKSICPIAGVPAALTDKASMAPSLLLLPTTNILTCFTRLIMICFLLSFPLSFLLTILNFPFQFPKQGCLSAFEKCLPCRETLPLLPGVANTEFLALLTFQFGDELSLRPSPMLPQP